MDVLSNSLDQWEAKFAQDLRTADVTTLSKPGGLLPLIPDHTTWDKFNASVREAWPTWRADLSRYPTCLIFLYAGIAFYEYDDNTFWPQFSRCVGSTHLPTSQQTEANTRFAEAASAQGFELRLHEHGTDYVGSAVSYVGIPLLLWDDFLDICNWALRREDWKSMPDSEWCECIDKRYGSRVRLRRFLTENREIVRTFIQEMLEAREILISEPSLQISALAKASILRAEFFEEVPDTATFLRPDNPDSLFLDKGRLVWSDSSNKLVLQLPAVQQNKLPATWRVGTASSDAATGPTSMVVESEAFNDPIRLHLELKSGEIEIQRLRGIGEWALFDLDSGGRIINPDRDEYPLHSYLLLSKQPINISSRDGFEEEDSPLNEPAELDGETRCYATRLWPFKSRAELHLLLTDSSVRTLTFRARSRIETQVLLGKGYKSGFFQRIVGDHVKMDHLPIFSVCIPDGYFKDTDTEVRRHFRVLVDDEVSSGHWQSLRTSGNTIAHYYEWIWSNKPLIELRPGYEKLSSLRELGAAFKASDLHGIKRFTVEGTAHFRASIRVEIIHRVHHDINDCWRELPGAVLPLFLICQSNDGLKWEELLIARDIVAPDLTLTPSLLRKYENKGVLIQRNHRWQMNTSLAETELLTGGAYILRYCGDPSILWDLYRWQCKDGKVTLPPISVINLRGSVPYMEMRWPLSCRADHEVYLSRRGVKFEGGPWTR